ncbi:MAG: AraC family transcriptional regulator [Chitinophagaceae bacterium]|nr:AraC family transcriptional regulator [Chitinophagaceae bacterium]
MFSFIRNHINYTLLIPGFPVNAVVDHFVIMKGNGTKIPERLFPNNKFEIFFNLGDKVSGKSYIGEQAPVIEDSIVSGLRHTYFDFFPPANYYMVGMRFTLFGFNHLFKIPAYHFTDKNLSATSVWGNEISVVQQRLLEAKDDVSVFTVLNDWILAHLSNCSLPQIAQWNHLEKKINDPGISVSELVSRHLGYSQKHAIHLFKNHAGTGPNAIKKMIRFDRAVQNISQCLVRSWAGFAYDSGFADQSHFIREFKSFTGYTPLEYINTKSIVYYFYENLLSEQ